MRSIPQSEAAVVLLADQPGIRARHVRSLVTAFETDPAEILRIRFRDGPGPAILARSVWDEAMALTGDTGARALFEARARTRALARLRRRRAGRRRPPRSDLERA